MSTQLDFTDYKIKTDVIERNISTLISVGDDLMYFIIEGLLFNPENTYHWILNNMVANQNQNRIHLYTHDSMLNVLVECGFNCIIDYYQKLSENVRSINFKKIFLNFTRDTIYNTSNVEIISIRMHYNSWKEYAHCLINFINQFKNYFIDVSYILNDNNIINEYSRYWFHKREYTHNVVLTPFLFINDNPYTHFSFMVKYKQYDATLFIFSDIEEQFISQICIPGNLNADMRPYQCSYPPRSSGIPVETFESGYNTITPHSKNMIDKGIDFIVEKCHKYNYSRVIYAVNQEGNFNTDGNFYLTPEISRYIIAELNRRIK
jgi:hypothetical protein